MDTKMKIEGNQSFVLDGIAPLSVLDLTSTETEDYLSNKDAIDKQVRDVLEGAAALIHPEAIKHALGVVILKLIIQRYSAELYITFLKEFEKIADKCLSNHVEQEYDNNGGRDYD